MMSEAAMMDALTNLTALAPPTAAEPPGEAPPAPPGVRVTFEEAYKMPVSASLGLAVVPADRVAAWQKERAERARALTQAAAAAFEAAAAALPELAEVTRLERLAAGHRAAITGSAADLEQAEASVESSILAGVAVDYQRIDALHVERDRHKHALALVEAALGEAREAPLAARRALVAEPQQVFAVATERRHAEAAKTLASAEVLS